MAATNLFCCCSRRLAWFTSMQWLCELLGVLKCFCLFNLRSEVWVKVKSKRRG